LNWESVSHSLPIHTIALIGCITGILEPLCARVYDEGEKGTKKAKAESLGGLLGSLGEVTQEGEDLLRGQGFRFPLQYQKGEGLF
jgi:hypothetical protein